MSGYIYIYIDMPYTYTRIPHWVLLVTITIASATLENTSSMRDNIVPPYRGYISSFSLSLFLIHSKYAHTHDSNDYVK